jgi:hypothetical protein
VYFQPIRKRTDKTDKLIARTEGYQVMQNYVYIPETRLKFPTTSENRILIRKFIRKTFEI